jgi:hypothetical protein
LAFEYARVSFIVLSTILALAAWTGIFVAGALEGWWRQSLAPSGDGRAFMDAAITTIDGTRRGNVAFVLIEDGKVFDEHFTSVGQPVDRNTFSGRLREQVDHGLGRDDVGRGREARSRRAGFDLSHALVPAEE